MYCSASVDHSKTHQNFITTSMRLSFRTSSNLKTLTAERNFHDHRYRTRIIRKWKTIPASFARLVHMSLGYAMHTADKTPWARLDAFLWKMLLQGWPARHSSHHSDTYKDMGHCYPSTSHPGSRFFFYLLLSQQTVDSGNHASHSFYMVPGPVSLDMVRACLWTFGYEEKRCLCER